MNPQTSPAQQARPRGPSARRRLRRLALAGTIAMLVRVLSACESTDLERRQVASLVNESRALWGLAPLGENTTLDAKADRWAQQLRDSCKLSHSLLPDAAPVRWQKLGENVGLGGSIGQVHTAYLESSGHRANILDPSYTSMGTAAVWGRCNGVLMVFTVQEFMR